MSSHPRVVADGVEGVDANVDLPVLLFVDTAGCGCDEILGEDGVSRANPDEAKVVSWRF